MKFRQRNAVSLLKWSLWIDWRMDWKKLRFAIASGAVKRMAVWTRIVMRYLEGHEQFRGRHLGGTVHRS